MPSQRVKIEFKRFKQKGYHHIFYVFVEVQIVVSEESSECHFFVIIIKMRLPYE